MADERDPLLTDEATVSTDVSDDAPVRMRSRVGRHVLAASILGSGVVFLESAVVPVAAPAIAADLDVGLSELQWVTNVYLLALGSLVLVGGALGDLLGLRRVFVVGLVGFGLATLACGLAPTDETLIAFRALQGVFAALVTPTSLALVSQTFTDDERTRAIGLWSAVSGLAVVVGPVAGGWLTDTLGWRWAFFLFVPFVVAAWAAAVRGVPGQPARVDRSHSLAVALDLPGAGLLVAALALIVGPLIEADRLSPGVVVGLVAAGFVLLGLSGIWEMWTPAPMLPPQMWLIRTFSVANVYTGLVYGGYYVIVFLLPITLQAGFGWAAMASGFAVAPLAILLALFSERVGAILPKVGARPLMAGGALLAAGGGVLLARLSTVDSAGYWLDVLPGFGLYSVGMLLLVVPVTSTALVDVALDHQGVAAGTNNAVSRVGGLLAVAVIPLMSGLTLASASDLDPAAVRDGFGRAMLITAAVLAAAAVVAAAGLRRSDGRS